MTVDALVEDLYCGSQNCYDVLGVKRGDVKATIARAYRRMARKYHPDIYKGKDAEQKFRLIAKAYEILKDDEERNNYDYMLDNPDLVYRHYYRYYKKRVSPKVDIRVVVMVTVTVVSLIQYLAGLNRYNDAIKYALRDQRYRNQAIEVAKSKGLWNTSKKKGKRSKMIGGYKKPSVFDVLFFQLCFSPLYIVQYIFWYLRWLWKFNVNKEPYGPEERIYLTRKKLGLSATKWESLPAEKQSNFESRELWIDENFKTFTAEMEEDMRVKNASSNKYKMYRRYMKNHKPSAMQID
ncbi:uncharacterized protein TRIADDRAFT_50730 [Trichoplax adhaerens]|uniref:J domain-containing protein n=1 Tax=Trichoplax adhaerens TaxID=10228 RepID=B3S5U2_TRIAD|nr:hypothetical protein TRIADDRAFT_50730 [Trichoplax adhaerens]EDV21960.1 hypothetical protein TRIADDRAFT_50730 [Trichoplax adhaerens]|eukprot:XP_002115597.1 hypothetical protein TRIADDRAFT_50730 [Trichoplax adhaerens]